MFNVQSAVFNVQSAVFNVQSAVFNVQSAVFNVQSAVFNVQSAVFNVQSAVYRVYVGKLITKVRIYVILTPINQKLKYLPVPRTLHSQLFRDLHAFPERKVILDLCCCILRSRVVPGRIGIFLAIYNE